MSISSSTSVGGVLCPYLSSLTSTCASPQQQSLFWISQVSKVFRHWHKFNIILPDALRATAACTFSTSCHIVPDVRYFPFFDFQICFARHFPRRQNIGKNAVFRFFWLFKRLHLLVSTWFSFFFLSIFPFLLTLPTSPVSVFHIVGRLPSQTRITASRSLPGQHHSICQYQSSLWDIVGKASLTKDGCWIRNREFGVQHGNQGRR